MGIRKIGCLLAVCLMVFMSRAYAENMQFVDANGSTGYYVDTDSISSDQVVENDVQKTLWTARVAVIPQPPLHLPDAVRPREEDISDLRLGGAALRHEGRPPVERPGRASKALPRDLPDE